MRAGEEARLGCAKNWAELGKRWARRWREKEGRKGIASSESQTFYWAPFAHGQEATVQFDWLLARQSKYDIRNLSFMHNPTSEHKIKIDMVESGEAFEGVFEFYVQETLKDLSQNGKLIVLKSKQEAAMRV